MLDGKIHGIDGKLTIYLLGKFVTAHIVIRHTKPTDIAVLTELVIEMLHHYGVPLSQTRAQVAAALVKDGPHGSKLFECLLAFLAERPVGLLMFSLIYDVGVFQPCVFIKDLYVCPEERNRRTGRFLMIELAKLAVAQNWQRIDWQTDTENAGAIRFYDSLANCRAGKVSFRLEGNAIAKLARDLDEGRENRS